MTSELAAWLAWLAFMAVPTSSFLWHRHKRTRHQRTATRLALIEARQQNLDLQAQIRAMQSQKTANQPQNRRNK